MPQINELSALNQLLVSDLFVVFSDQNGDTRKVGTSVIQAFMQANLDFGVAGIPQFETQYSVPSATDFSVTIAPPDDGDNVHLILTPTGPFADGTIVLPAVATVIDKQLVLVNSTQAVTTLVVDGNGATAVTGEPATLAQNGFFTLKFDLPTLTWYRVW